MKIKRRQFLLRSARFFASIPFISLYLSRSSNAAAFTEIPFGSVPIGGRFKVLNLVENQVSENTPVLTKVEPIPCDPVVDGPNICSRATCINVNYVSRSGSSRTAFFPDDMKVILWN